MRYEIRRGQTNTLRLIPRDGVLRGMSRHRRPHLLVDWAKLNLSDESASMIQQVLLTRLTVFGVVVSFIEGKPGEGRAISSIFG